MLDNDDDIFHPPAWRPGLVMLQGAPEAVALPITASIEGITDSLVRHSDDGRSLWTGKSTFLPGILHTLERETIPGYFGDRVLSQVHKQV